MALIDVLPLFVSLSCSSLQLQLSLSEHLLTSPLRVCELLGLNDFLLPPPVNRAPFDQANEIENFHLSQIDFKHVNEGGKKKNKKAKTKVLVERDMHIRRAHRNLLGQCVFLLLSLGDRKS